MGICRDDRVRMERAHVLAWPALRTARIDGWLWRASGGGSQRANSVSTIDFIGNDPNAAIREVEDRYAAVGAKARFHTFDDTAPPGLADQLRARGYQETEETITMLKRPERAAGLEDIAINDRASPEWYATYLGAITDNRREVNARIINSIPGPNAFFGCRRDGQIVATALSVIGYDCAVIECVATRADARRQGAARAVVQAVDAWAERHRVGWLGLQVSAHNVAAIRLYEQLGFTPEAVNRFWIQG